MESFYKQHENTVDLYNEKSAQAPNSILDKLHAANKLTKTPFDGKIKWTCRELWHHQGRRARMGTAMMGPDYTQWHGFYEVAKTFYTEFIPEPWRPSSAGVTSDVMNGPYPRWRKRLSKEQLQQQLEFIKRSTASDERQRALNGPEPRQFDGIGRR